MKLKTIFGQNVKYYRYRKRFTQERLGELLNASPNYIGRIERGQHTLSFDKIETLAKILGIEVFELFVKREQAQKLPFRVDMASKNE